MKIHILKYLLIVVIAYSCGNPHASNLQQLLFENRGDLTVELVSFENSKVKDILNIPIRDVLTRNKEYSFGGAQWILNFDVKPKTDTDKAFIIQVSGKVKSGKADNVSLGLKLNISDWSDQNYVLMPGAAYNGNRYRAIKKIKGLPTSKVIALNPGIGPLFSNVPRLNLKGESKLQQLSGDMATPAVGIRSEKLKKGLFIFSEQGSEWGDYSYKIYENASHDSASIIIRLPGVREDSVYRGGANPFFPSPDKGGKFESDDEIVLQCNIGFFDAPVVQSVFDYFMTIRKSIGNHSIPNEIPYSAAWQLQEKKYNLQNWVEEYGYYSVGMRESMYQDWQTGWTGGMNAVYPLLVNGSDSTYARALRTFDFLFDRISPAGFFYDVFYDGEWRLTDESTFLRRNSDALYFIMKSFDFICRKDPDFVIPDKWIAATKGCADAYVNLWKKYGEFGQSVDYETGEIVAFGTSSNGIASGALALCSRFFNSPKYMNVAKASAEAYYQNFIKKGYTNGGPGDIYQCIDSESVFGLLESFVVLYEETGERKWLKYAEETAKQCATWVVSYNFKFPPESTFARMNMLTTGTVIANVQNKHAAPGICSLSGNSLFKLYRYTGNYFYLDLIKDITKTMPQYMSRDDRPIPDVRPNMPWPIMPSGWINERVNMSDWEERGELGNIKRGEIFGGSTWSEVAFMNAYADLPGIYVLNDKGEVTVLDNVEAKVVDKNILEVTNPTKFRAKVKVLFELSEDQKNILKTDYMEKCKIIEIPENDKVKIEF